MKNHEYTNRVAQNTAQQFEQISNKIRNNCGLRNEKILAVDFGLSNHLRSQFYRWKYECAIQKQEK